MITSQYLANRLIEVFLNGKWIANTNYKEQIASVNWEQATKQFQNLNSIAMLTFHINYYLEGLIKAFETGILDISDKFSFDMPAITNAEEWNVLVASFLKHAEQFVQLVEQMKDENLNLPFIDPKYGTILRNIEGVIEHSYYHLGQIVLIRKFVVV